MSTAGQSAAAAQAGAAEAQANVLDQIFDATKATERSRTEELMKTLTDEALKGTVAFSKNVTQTLNKGIAAIDAALSKQLAAILHHPDFQKLEGTWRGLNY